MLNVALDAKVSWPNGNSMTGRVTLNYIEVVDPWLVHATFEVRGAASQMDIERSALIVGAGRIVMGGAWMGTANAPVRIGCGANFIKFRITDQDNGGWTDFDVPMRPLRTFLADTINLCSEEDEQSALTRLVDEGIAQL